MKDIIEHTLKKKGRWSRTSLTMFTAWIIAIVMALYDLWDEGFRFEVFMVFSGIALGSKIVEGAHSNMTKNEKHTTPTDA